MGEVELKPCPWCGSEPQSNKYYAWCFNGHGVVQLPLDQWNTRALTGGVTQIDSAGKPYDPANMVSPLPCKCGWQWSVTDYPHDVCGQCSGEYVVICPRCKESGPLKAQPWWAVNAWNDQRTAAIGGVTQADVGVTKRSRAYTVEITCPNGSKLAPYRIDRDALVMASDSDIGYRLAADILAMLRASQASGEEGRA